jgi:molybdopterin converting factor small subunit
MVIKTLLFASYADVLGSDELELELSPGATVGEAVAAVRALPGGGNLPPAPLVAVNLRYSDAAARLSAGDELAIIPPVAGG